MKQLRWVYVPQFLAPSVNKVLVCLRESLVNSFNQIDALIVHYTYGQQSTKASSLENCVTPEWSSKGFCAGKYHNSVVI